MDINHSQNNNRALLAKLLLLSCFFILGACGGGGGGDNASGSGGNSTVENPSNNQAVINDISGQALLGPIIGADVDIFSLTDTDTSICSTKTTTSDDIETAGLIILPETCPTFSSDTLYLITVSGGQDIDADDDGNLDETSTQVEGVVRAIISGDQLMQSDWTVTALSEAIYQAVQYSLNSGNMSYIASELKRIAPLYLTEDITGDGNIDEDDLIAWHPRKNAASVIDIDQILSLITDIHAGLNRPISAQTTTVNGLSLFNIAIRINELIVQDSIAYIATDSALIVADVSDPKNIVIQSSVALGFIHDMDVQNNIVALAMGEAGIQFIDTTNISNPAITSLISGTYQLLHWHENGLVALASDEENKRKSIIYSIDTKNIATPNVLDTILINGNYFDEASYSHKIKIKDNLLFASLANLDELTSEISIIDLSNNRALKLLSTISADNFTAIINDFVFDNNSIYTITYSPFTDSTISAFDISQPRNPIPIGSTSNTRGLTSAKSIQAFDGGIYALTSSGLEAYALPTFEKLFTIATPNIKTNSFSIIDNTAYILSDSQVITTELNPISPIEKVTGYALLGRIVNAQIDIHDIRNINAEPLCTAISQDSDNISTAGLIEIPAACVSKPGYYQITISGGENIDSNNDGVRDEFPVVIDGTMHGYFSSFDLGQSWSVNPLTEIAYQLIKPLVVSGNIDIAINQADQYAKLILLKDTNGSQADSFGRDLIDNYDLSNWMPSFDAQSYLAMDDPSLWLTGVIDAITNNLSLNNYVSSLSSGIDFLAIDGLIEYLPQATYSVAKTDNNIFLINDKNTDPISIYSRISATSTTDIAIYNNLLFIAKGEQGISIYNIEDLSSPIKTADIEGIYNLIAIANNYLFAVSKTSNTIDLTGFIFTTAEVTSFDITNAANPIVLQRHAIDAGISDANSLFTPRMDTINDHIYLTLAYFGDNSLNTLAEDVFILNTSNPSNISIGNILGIRSPSSNGGIINSVQTAKDTYLVGTGFGSFFSGDYSFKINMSNPLTATFDSGDYITIPSGLFFSSSKYFKISDDDIQVYSFEDYLLESTLSLPLPTNSTAHSYYPMYIDGNFLYLSRKSQNDYVYTSTIARIPLP